MLTARDLEAVLPLSPQQRGMLFESLRAPGSGIFIEQAVLSLHGELDPAAFQNAWRRLVERHAILRTAFLWEDQQQPLQAVLRRAEAPVVHVDLRALPEERHAAALAEHLVIDSRRGLALRHPPPMRLAVFRMSGSEYRFVWTVHHVALDGWCRTIVLEEFLVLYSGFREGREPALAPARPYGDYIVWLQRQDLARAEAFWRGRLQGIEAAPLFPAAPGGRDAVTGDRYGSASGRLEPAVAERLRTAGVRHRVTVGTLLQGALALLLSRYSGREDVVLGITVAGRPADLPGVDSIVGLFTNTLPLRARVPPGGPLWDWLRQLQSESVELRQFEHCSEGQVHEWSGLPGRLPLYDCVLVLENYPLREADDGSGGIGIEIADAVQQGARTKYLLTLVASVQREVALQLVYDGRRISGNDANRIVSDLAALLQHVAGEPETDIAGLRAAIPDGEPPRARPLAEPAGSHTGALDETPPGDALEERLARAWAETLGLDRVGVHASFLELGGHSLLAMRLADKIREALGREIPLRLLFAAPTAASLAHTLRSGAAGDLGGGAPPGGQSLPALVPCLEDRHGTFPLHGVQRHYWLARGGADSVPLPGSNLYVQVELPGTDAGLLGRLRTALGTLVERHDMLRAVFLPDGQQRVLPEVPPYELSVADLSGLAAEAAMARVDEARDDLRHRRAPVERWPLFDFLVQLLPAGKARLHARFEALLLDGDSRDLLFRELLRLLSGAGLPPAPGITYRDFVTTWRQAAAAEPFRRSRQHWLGRLPTLPPPLHLPAPAAPRPPARSRYARWTGEMLDRETWARLRQRAGRAGLTPSAVVTAAFARLLGRASGQNAFCLPVVGNLRPPMHPDLDRVVGNFDELHPLPVEDAAAPLMELARRLQEETAMALEHRYTSRAGVLLELHRRPGARSPVPAVFFNSMVELDRSGAETPRQEGASVPVLDLAITIPQAILECTVAETRRETLLGLWQWLDEEPSAGLVAEIRKDYEKLLRHLACEDVAWREARPAGADRLAAP